MVSNISAWDFPLIPRRLKMWKGFFFRITLTSLLLSGMLFSQWISDPAENNPICTANNSQLFPRIASDGNGGAIIVWTDWRSGSNLHIYAQRITKDGVLAWQKNGIPVCVALYHQDNPVIVSDNTGGAIITWEEYRNQEHKDIYAQRVTGNGDTVWKANGIPICTALGRQQVPLIISDDSGGAIISWLDYRGSFEGIYAQRVTPSGQVLWDSNGVKITSNGASRAMTIDGAKGTIIAWEDKRNENPDIYAQRILHTGTAAWTSDGIPIATGIANQQYPEMVTDHYGGAILTWQDDRTGDYDIYVQHLTGNGEAQLGTNGMGIATADGNQQYPRLADVSLKIGGIYEPMSVVVWAHNQGGINSVYAKYLDTTGIVWWGSDSGVFITNGYLGGIVSVGSNNAIVTWLDEFANDIYAQKVSWMGKLQWQEEGVPISTAAESQSFHTLISDNAGGAIVTWEDHRVSSYDIYAAHLTSNPTSASLGNERPPSEYSLSQNYPNPFNPSTKIVYTLPVRSKISLIVYNILGEEIAVLASGYKEAGVYESQFNGRNFSSGIYIYRLKANDYTQSKKFILIK